MSLEDYEYKRVAQLSQCQDLLERANQTKLSQSDVEAIVKSFDESIECLFYVDIRSNATYIDGKRFIRFSADRLTLGLAIHELAHHLVGLHERHNKPFIEKLDELALKLVPDDEYEFVIAKYHETHKKERAKSLGQILKAETKCPTCGREWIEKCQFSMMGILYVQLECGHLIEASKGIKKHPAATFKSIRDENLYPFQEVGVQFFEQAVQDANIRGILIGDEMGLGKTPQSFAIAKLYDLVPFIFICKAGLISQMEKMATYWANLDFIQVIKGSRDKPLPGVECYIVSYNTLGRLRNPAETFKGLGIKLLIIDECQMIKNPDTQMARAVTSLASLPDVKVVGTSGTPIKNNAAEYYPILHIISPRMFRTFSQFVNEHVDYYRVGPYLKYGGLRRPAQFKELTEKFIIRRLQKDVLPDLPPIRRNYEYVDVSENIDADAYNRKGDEFQEFYYSAKKEDLQFYRNILEYLTAMRHIAGDSKVPAAVEYTKDFLESTDRKLLIFVHHHSVADSLVRELTVQCSELSKPPLRIMAIAEQGQEERDKAVELFTTDPEYRICVASTLASGEGLNLQGQCSDCLIVEHQWNPANEMQAEFRLKRIGQKAESVNSIRMVALGTIDEYFVELKERKAGIYRTSLDFDTAMNLDEGSVIKELAAMIAARGTHFQVKSKR